MSSPDPSPTKSLWNKLRKNVSNDSVDSTHGSKQIAQKSNVSRPVNLKSRSFHTPGKNYSQNEQLIRKQRDDFFAAQQKLGFGPNEIFGVTLEESIKVAESKISIESDDPSEFGSISGKIPLLAGHCGLFLKRNGLKVEGIFRIAGSSKRVKELQYLFSSPPDYGRKLQWEGYTVHDAASLFRRFLNNLPEPLVPLTLYEDFRKPIKSRVRIINHIKERSKTIDNTIRHIQERKQKMALGEEVLSDDDAEKANLQRTEEQKAIEARKTKRIARDIKKALKEYRILIEKLPEAHRLLLFYLLDMLSLFAKHSSYNLMPSKNLAAIFQPSILTHPYHDLTPEEYALSQAVVEILIEYSSKLIPHKKKHKTESADENQKPRGASETLTSKPIIVKSSAVDLLAVRNSSKGSRPHSRSLSSANGVPEALTTNISELLENEQVSNSEDDGENEDDEDDEDEDEEEEVNDDGGNRFETTPEEPVKPVLATVVKQEQAFEKSQPISSPNPPIERILPKQRARPISMFPSLQTRHLSKSETDDTNNENQNQESRKKAWLKKFKDLVNLRPQSK